jgi:hypothetical protein
LSSKQRKPATTTTLSGVAATITSISGESNACRARSRRQISAHAPCRSRKCSNSPRRCRKSGANESLLRLFAQTHTRAPPRDNPPPNYLMARPKTSEAFVNLLRSWLGEQSKRVLPEQ